jgi:hypothetical protein
MSWFRANKGSGGRLALFALALQFYLAFGHIHPEDIYGPAQITLPAASSIVLPAAEALRAIPADQKLGHSDKLCAICEAMYFLGLSFTPDGPQILPLPRAWWPLEPLAAIAAIAVDARRAPFQSRAPPPHLISRTD